MAEQIKDFGGNVNRDVAFSKAKEDILYDSQNFRIITDEGGTLGVRTNIKGNTKILEIPDTPAEIELILLEELVVGHIYTLVFNITNYATSITSSVTITLNYSGVTSFYGAVKTQLLTYTLNSLHALYNAQILLPSNYTKLIIRGTFSGISSFVATEVGPPPVDVTSKVSLLLARPTQTALKIIGWCTIRDTIYLLTTNGTFNPDVDPPPYTSLGQWWRLDYDKSLSPSDPLNYTLQLVYNNEMNVTIQKPVANPGMIEGRYENENIQKIYWTDNFNVPRQINVAPSRDSITAALTVEQLNLIPSLNMEPARITGISDGALYAGVYFVMYRLLNLNNSETRFSRTSVAFPILDAREGVAAVGYYPDKTVDDPNGINSFKSIRVQIDNIDTEYNTIELATVWYKNNVDLPEIRLVKQLGIPANGKIDTFITGNEDKVIITLDEATAFTTAIKRCKTLAAKKQTLFLGNLTIASQKVDFDTRTYRFPINSTTTTIRDASANTYTIDSTLNFQITHINGVATTPYDVPEDYDCIQDYDDQDPTSDQNFLYLPNSNVLGGEGPNMSYVFITKTDMNLDTIVFNNNNPNFLAQNGPFITPGQTTTTFENISWTDFTAQNQTYSNFQSPFNYGLYEGYTRDELYRFGVVFYDQLDNPTFVNWAADIRMPHIYMPDTTAGALFTSTGSEPRSTVNYTYPNGDVLNTRPTSYTTATQYIYGNALGIRFTFKNVPSDSYYQTASIVRTERTQGDKHVIGQGLFRHSYTAASCWAGAGDWEFLCPIDPNGNSRTFKPANGDTYTTSSGTGMVWSFHSPETVRFLDPTGSIINETVLSPPGATDTVEIVSIYTSTQSKGYFGWYNADTQNYFTANGGYADDFNIPGGICGDGEIEYWATFRKYYNFIETSSIPTVIKGYTGPGGGTNNPYKVVRLFDNDSKYWNAQQEIFTTTAPWSKKIAPCLPTAFAVDPPAWKQGTGCDGQNAGPGLSGNDAEHHMSALARCNVLELDYNEAVPDFAENISSNRTMLLKDNIWNTDRTYIANYKKSPPLPYGGNTYFTRSLNEYISCGNFVNLNGGSVDTIVFGGDTVIELFDKITDHFNNSEHQAVKNAGASFSPGPKWSINYPTLCQYPAFVRNIMRTAFFPVETSIPIGYRRIRPDEAYSATAFNNGGNVPNKLSWLVGNPDGNLGSNRIEAAEYFGLDPVYIHNSKGIYRYFPFNPSTIPTETFDCRVWRSENKIDGELIESWSIYKAGAFKDVESAYGPLNNLVVFQDKLYFIQDKGFGTLQVDEQKLITDAQGESDLVLGSTGLLERYDYISTKTGTKHQFSMSVSDYTMIWFDTLARKLMRYKPGELQPVSDIRGYHAFLYQETDGIIQTDDNPYIFQGVHSTYDYRFNEFYMTFVQPSNVLRDGRTMPPNPFTLVFNELFDGFVGRYTHHPTVYINDKSNIFSIPANLDTPLSPSSMYVHHYGDYSVFYDEAPAQSTISFVINESPTIEKVLNNLEVSVEVFDVTKQLFAQPMMYKFFDRMRVYDNYQNSDFIQLVPGLARKHKTIWNIKIPSDRVLDVTQPIFDASNLSVVRPSITRRFKDKWFIIDLVYDNLDNYKLVAHNAKAIFTANSR